MITFNGFFCVSVYDYIMNNVTNLIMKLKSVVIWPKGARSIDFFSLYGRCSVLISIGWGKILFFVYFRAL